MIEIAKTPSPPYYAVIFTNSLTTDSDGYVETAERMLELATDQPGYLGVESAREGLGITVSYWESLEAIAHWKQQAEHLQAQKSGQERWYANYKTRIAKVERDYDWDSQA